MTDAKEERVLMEKTDGFGTVVHVVNECKIL